MCLAVYDHKDVVSRLDLLVTKGEPVNLNHIFYTFFAIHIIDYVLHYFTRHKWDMW